MTSLKQRLLYTTTLIAFLAAPQANAIVGGQEVSANDPIAQTTVGLLMVSSRGQGICTGSLIGNNQVLTAGHCAFNYDKMYVVFGRNIFAATQNPDLYRPVIKRNVAMGYIKNHYGVPQNDHSDLAIVTYSGTTPLGYTSAKLMSPELAKVAVKDEAKITLAGFGATDFWAKTGSGVLRKISTKISKFYVSGKSVKVGTSSKGACHGDSGGPAIINYNGVDYVFAVISRSTDPDGACTGRAVYSLIY